MQETQEMLVRSLVPEGLREEGTLTHSHIFDGGSHGQRSLVGYSPCGRTELDTFYKLLWWQHLSNEKDRHTRLRSQGNYLLCVFAFLAIPCPSPGVDFLASLWDSDEGQMRERGTLVHSHPVGIPLESPCFPWNMFRVEKKVHTNRIDWISSWRRLLRVRWTVRRLNQSIL